jgi:propanol-preferring alcohol dehydrogenase
MRAMLLQATGPIDDNEEPLALTELPRPVPRDNEVLIEVSVCGVCHTELDEIEGRTPPPNLPIIPGHEVIGRVVEMGARSQRFSLHDRVGVGWIHSSQRISARPFLPPDAT